MTRLALVLMATSGLGLMTAHGSAAQLSRQDQTFIDHAATSNVAEINAGQMAANKAASAPVKQLGETMVADHTKANDQLAQIAQQEGISLPTQPTAQQRAEAQKLMALNGTQFDQAFAQNEVQDHEKAIAEFRTEAKSGHDPALKSFAEQTIPVLQKHLRMAQGASRG